MKTMKTSWTSKCYDVWAYFYDHTFGALVHQRHHAAMSHIRAKPGSLVLDLGVGTGMMLADYPDDITVIGADLSAGMLAKAMGKKNEHNLKHVTLIQANAMFPPLAEHCFDHIMIAHTISVVHEPNKLLLWAQRLVKPGGTIVLLNHFHAQNRLVASIETLTNPIFMKIGWKSDLKLEDCLKGTDLNVQYLFKTSWMDLWQIAVLSPGPNAHDNPSTQDPAEQPELHLASE